MQYSLEKLSSEVKAIVDFMKREVAGLPEEKLLDRPASGGWSLLECLEHLNRYNAYYIPHLEKAIPANRKVNSKSTITLSWIGKKSVEMVSPANGKKHKTFWKMDPQRSRLDASVVIDFLNFQERLLLPLGEAQETDLSRKAIPVEFFRLLKMNTGETLLFLVLHEQRHFNQLQRILAEVSGNQQAVA